MTGDIRAQLASSEAAESLRMEAFIAGCFRQRQWPAERGVYYNDPLINLSIFCECKSLAGWNVLLAEGDVDKTYENRMICHWSGYEEYQRGGRDLIARSNVRCMR
jgi:hypothetical protein